MVPGGWRVKFALRGDESAGQTVESAGGTLVGPTDAAALIAAGESALLSLAEDPAPVPVLPVDAGIGRHDVPRERLSEALEALIAGAYRTVDHPLLSIEIGGDRVARAAVDATLMTSEPAHISEYAVRVDGRTVDRFRADGVVVATPAGSEGYARAAHGPRIEPGTGLAVVPVSPYATDADTWVFPPAVELTVERDDAAVSLFADDREVRRVDADEPVAVGRDGDLTFVRPSLDPPA